MENDLIRRVTVLKLIEDIKMNPEIPKNYGTLLDIMREVRKIPAAYDLDKVGDKLENYLFEKYCVEGDMKIDEILKSGGVS